ncbi:nuclear transport factor 2 family protein [Sunxiuqinia sp. A32]|uniref:nuclear transport factor 2 family protein n=1 Tax=Sunxiuqinia sp. A32 TaxID=3461496 RepID=UPI0040467621
MKRLSILIFFLMVSVGVFAQQKNGTVFIEHPAIDKVSKLWAAFEKGDQAAYSAFLADTVMVLFNGDRNFRTKEKHAKTLEWWINEFENLKVVTDTPAYADAIEYEKGGLWVQDWLQIIGTHKKSGINLDLRMHNLYSFDDDGKIRSLHHYFNNDQFEAINSSTCTQENGKVYINHPLILKVRKLVNAYCAEDLDEMLRYYSDDVTFANTTMKLQDQNDLAAQKKEWADIFAKYDNIQMKQVGYPDCIYYAKSDDYVVYSWWNLTAERVEDGKKIELPIMLSHSFGDDKKIVNSLNYYSSNHLE